MIRKLSWLLAGGSFFLALMHGSGGGLRAQEILVEAATIHTVSGEIVRDGMVRIADGKIAAVGRELRISPATRRVRAEVVVPGFIDAHTHVALDRSTRPPGPVTAEWRARDHVDLDDPMLRIALSGGLTSLITRPGSGIVSSGQAVALKLRGTSGPSRVLKPFVDLKMAVRPLINLREGETPATVMGWYAIADDHFRRAQHYSSSDGDGDKRLDAFVSVLRGDAMLHVHSHYPSEIQMVLSLARKYDIVDRLVLSHAQESFPIADVLSEAGVRVVVGPVFIGRYFGGGATHNVVQELMAAGVVTSVQTDQGAEQLRDFREYGAFLIRHGLSENDALAALTLNGAKAMGLEDRVGSIDVGKDADLILLDGDPFDLTRDPIEAVLVDGVIEYERPSGVSATARRMTEIGPVRALRSSPPPGPSFNLVNAHLFTVSSGVIRGGTLVVDSGRIVRLGAAAEPDPALPTFDAGGRVVMPGFVSARAYPNDWTGDLKWQVQNDETTETVTPEMNARFAVDPWFPSFEVMREVGLTAQQITPGHQNLIGGSGVVVKTASLRLQDMVRREPSSMVFALSDPQSVRAWLERARQYSVRASTHFDPRLEAFGPVLAAEVPAIMHANTVSEIRDALDIANEFSLRLVISGGRQAHLVADELSAADVPVILGDTASRLEALRGGGEGYEARAPAILSEAGVSVSFYGPSGARRGMPTGRLGGEPALNAAWAYRNGASEVQALAMVTLNAARVAGVSDRLGSLDVGKDADLVIFDGHPFDYRAKPSVVYIDGRRVYAAPDR